MPYCRYIFFTLLRLLGITRSDRHQLRITASLSHRKRQQKPFKNLLKSHFQQFCDKRQEKKINGASYDI